ncbi:nucleoporin Pom152 [Coprinopsis cinerea okayama7|uniref:Nucleoporin Pom152 n=1 Tax=Coprinopsis cinerea (strain Okayama-7 / 130 / ATCC MYA-4618 / FGSC 9003) TaxID=240176 RepID=A8N2Q5_COPC7|nr:nucleoporin Pom152 [Coprinopsis cinerea okayama7\|eukprot:XP_001829189.2 nucleoporin Pom152 [Coprinopsis cinerea okayama7\
MASKTEKKQDSLIPEAYLDYPSQRLYSLSLWLLCQLVTISVINCFLFGGLTITTGGASFKSSSRPESSIYSSSGFDLLSYIAPLSFGLIGSSGDGHLLGQHTVRMSPISTAQLNPQSDNFCLSPTSKFVLVPVLLNNTEVAGLRYTQAPLKSHSDAPPKIERFDLSARDLKAIAQAYQDLIQTTKPQPPTPTEEEDEYDEYDDDDDEDEHSRPQSNLEKSQNLVYLRVSKPGIIKLEHVIGSGNVEARISPGEVVVVPCPTVSFPDPPSRHQEPEVQCAGQDNSRELTINVYGVPPLSLRWAKSVNGQKEQFLVEGIEGEHGHAHRAEQASGSIVQSTRHVAEPDRVQLPLTVTLNSPGTYVYTLEEIVDGVGNVVKMGNDGNTAATTSTKQSFVVLTRPAISFSHCSLENPKALLIGSETSLPIRASSGDARDGPWEISMKYQPDPEDTSKKHKPWNKIIKASGDKPDASLMAGSPGEYSIVGIKGKVQFAFILETRPILTVSASSTAPVLFSPPVFYRVQRDNEPTREHSKTFSSSRGELTLQPERSGHYIFTFVSLSDANYRKVELRGPSIEQIIHPLASADFADSHISGKTKRSINSCSGQSVDVAVDLKGTGPWNLEVQVIGPQSSETLRFDGLQTSRAPISVPVPQSIVRNGGQFEIVLLSVEDAYKCKRSLSAPGIVVNVKRTRPTARFYGTDEERYVSITENDEGKLPLRLTGSGPWSVVYRRTDTPSRNITARLLNPNDHITVRHPGTYELLSVNDSQCPGTIASEASTYRVDIIPRPTAKLSPETPATFNTHNGRYTLRTVCEGVSDHVDLELTGRPPFQIMYNIGQPNGQGGIDMIEQPTINSIQPRTRFQLLTSTPGRMLYGVKQIGDSVYPLEKNADQPPGLIFEQQVAMRPSAHFKNRNRMTYCLHDTFVPLDKSSSDGVVVLEGQPPFMLTLTVRNVAASQTQKLLVEVPSNVWKLDLPTYEFASVGPHRVTIDSVSDSSNCAQSELDPLLSSIWVDVAETASIIPFENRPDVCVGEITQFQLEGIPPWTIGYRVNSRSYTKEVKTSPFSIAQQQPGEFTITSIAHQQQMCKAVVTDLRFNVHPLPSAKVGQGKKIFQDIHEGDQAEIVFTLIGEPPFTFTYQRAEPSSRKGGKPGRVLETHTVSRVMTHEYSIFSALEGMSTRFELGQ